MVIQINETDMVIQINETDMVIPINETDKVILKAILINETENANSVQ